MKGTMIVKKINKIDVAIGLMMLSLTINIINLFK